MNKKIVKQLAQKKYRDETGLFLIQGRKSAQELLASNFNIQHIFCTKEYAQDEPQCMKYPHTIVSTSELVSLGTLEENDSVVIVAQKRPASHSDAEGYFKKACQHSTLIQSVTLET